ncbi:hypothetical protein LY90DRAFT_677348 [Neocallimastix californiae]|uniref:Uncharacterized protein n=1 Tax=Neocallimastix californiae TaxID=1754190 RepID=A0A1Y2A4G4_9FUNG|nr:hypothetical protein LY90DRAFT_677348 [Neocallimastix californiae]|eukprot:ORY17187.1 hypothetical protein LY90DRAFT_677348 [Neocallimastix californiae]
MFKNLLTALLIATACITYVCGIKLVGPAIYSDISHLYFLNSRDCKNTYICKGYGIIIFYDCFLRNSVVNYREIPVGAYLRDTQYKNPDKCKWITRHISTIMDVITHQITQEVDFHGEVMLIVMLLFMI